jgi:ubiquinone/menaquinone biosynthesis C-methylase UbiE
MERIRRPFQGVANVVRFNWPLYLLSLGLAAFLLSLGCVSDELFRAATTIAGLLLVGTALLSVLVSFYVYDLSDLYRMAWAGECPTGARIVNVHAGFDETSTLLQAKFRGCELIVLDFFDPARHTEASIRRARRASLPFPGTRSIGTTNLPLAHDSIDRIFVTFSAHEIRNRDERIAFFQSLRRCLKPEGQILVTEHLRDWPNFLAYTVGFLHFLSARSWRETFRQAVLHIAAKRKTTPFITTFVLEKHGNPA